MATGELRRWEEPMIDRLSHAVHGVISTLTPGAVIGFLSGIGVNGLIHTLAVPGTVFTSLLYQTGVTVSTDWVGYGVGGAIAIIVIQWKRADDAEHAKKISLYASSLEAISIRLENSLTNSSQVIKDNTAAFASMEAAFQSMNQFGDVISLLESMKRERGDEAK